MPKSFRLAIQKQYINCRYDDLYVGNVLSTTLITSVNDTYKRTYDLADQYVVVNFTSDGSVNYRGFQLEYESGKSKLLESTYCA